MATVASKLLTAEEFYEWANHPDNRDKHCDLVRGEIVELPRAGRQHGFVCAHATGILGNFAIQRKKGYVCCNGTGVIVERDPDTVFGLDVLFFEDARSYYELNPGFSETLPLLAVEVLAPGDSAPIVNRRIREQLAFGIRLVWLLDPEAQNLTVYRAGKEYQVLEEADELTEEEVLPDFRCRVGEFFQFPGA